jgi:hypothetical protein
MEPVYITNIGVGYLSDFIGKRNEAARAVTPGAFNAQIKDVANEFYKVGFPRTLVTTYAIAQMMHESDFMTSSIANSDKNYSGIILLNKPYQDATKGSPRPKSEGGGYYARYATFGKWAKDFLRILSLNRVGAGRPIDATSAQQYLDRLKANNYFTDPNYYGAFNRALKKVSDTLRWGGAQDQQFVEARKQGQETFTYAGGEGITSNAAFDADRSFTGAKNWWTGLAPWKKGGLIIGTGLVVIMIIKK